MSFQQVHKISVLGQKNCSCFLGCLENFVVFSVSQSDLPKRLRCKTELRSYPNRGSRRQVGVQPDCHAAMEG